MGKTGTCQNLSPFYINLKGVLRSPPFLGSALISLVHEKRSRELFLESRAQGRRRGTLLHGNKLMMRFTELS